MARLGSKQRKGFYAFPPQLLPHVTKWLKVANPEKTTILDPCAGEGEAIAEFGKLLSLSPEQLYCSELDEERAIECEAQGMPTIVGDATGDSSFPIVSAFWLNPPYDVTSTGRRLEHLFLARLKRYLRNLGVLIFIVPFHILQRDEFKEMPDYFKHLRILLFPVDDDPYGQCVLMGLRSQGKVEAERENWKKQLANPRSLLDPPEFKYVIPESPVLTGDELKRVFYSRSLTDRGILSLMDGENKHLFGELHSVKFAEAQKGITSLMPLRTGHQALALAAGAFNGVYRDPESGNTLVVLGKTTRTVEDVSREEDQEADKTRERVIPTSEVLAWDLTQSCEQNEVVLCSYK